MRPSGGSAPKVSARADSASRRPRAENTKRARRLEKGDDVIEVEADSGLVETPENKPNRPRRPRTRKKEPEAEPSSGDDDSSSQEAAE